MYIFIHIIAFVKYTKSELKNEQWRDVIGYQGLYEISELGRIRRIFTYKNGKLKRRKPMVLCNHSKGYLCTRLSKNNIKKLWLAHVLVANAFIPNPKSLPEVNHKDNIKSNNRVFNLEWCTRQYNVRHYHDNFFKYKYGINKKERHKNITAIIKRKVNLSDLISSACREYDINEKVFCLKNRQREVAYARGMVFFILRQKYKIPIQHIGEQIGRHHHATVLWWVQKVRSRHSLRMIAKKILANV